MSISKELWLLRSIHYQLKDIVVFRMDLLMVQSVHNWIQDNQYWFISEVIQFITQEVGDDQLTWAWVLDEANIPIWISKIRSHVLIFLVYVIHGWCYIPDEELLGIFWGGG